jgi:hypothetical protein
MAIYNTLHIFGYGETQVITDTENKKVATDSIVGVQALVVMTFILRNQLAIQQQLTMQQSLS